MKLRSLAYACTCLVAACGGKAAGPASPDTGAPVRPTPAGGDAFPAPRDLAVFTPGATWTFQVHSTTSFMDEEDPAADASGVVTQEGDSRVTCHVAEVGTFDGGVLGHVACDGDLAATGMIDPLTGWWAANDVGLWRLEGDPPGDGAPELAPEEMILPARPVAGSTSRVLDEEMGFEEHVEINGDGKVWCQERSWSAGDGGWLSICFDAVGPASGVSGFSGGAESEVEFKRVP
ncbi:MAG: hypothetical protein KC464_22925 [Myxococcales bacterium]|nr:hypothetical protein [Myxococcales bacterium]